MDTTIFICIIVIVVIVLYKNEKFHSWLPYGSRPSNNRIYDIRGYPRAIGRTGWPGPFFMGLHPYKNWYVDPRDYQHHHQPHFNHYHDIEYFENSK